MSTARTRKSFFRLGGRQPKPGRFGPGATVDLPRVHEWIVGGAAAAAAVGERSSHYRRKGFIAWSYMSAYYYSYLGISCQLRIGQEEG